MSDSRIMTQVVTPIMVTVNYVLALAGFGIVLWFLGLFWGDKILMTFDELWGSGFSSEGIGRVWFIFVWCFAVTVVCGLIWGRSSNAGSRTVEVLHGWWISLNAGVFEELIYRWMSFFVGMIMLTFFNWLTLWIVDGGLVQWISVHILVPTANVFTLHTLDAQLHDPRSWIIGAAIIWASVKFRDAHEHLGLFGWVNSWFIGMIMFWLMFNYGILTAIVAHILYDVVVFTTAALMPERR